MLGGCTRRSVTVPLAPSFPPSLSTEPLVERATIADPLFERLSVEHTKVSFENRIIDPHPLRHLYATEKVCGGVAIGDVNDDGMPDLFFTSGPESNAL